MFCFEDFELLLGLIVVGVDFEDTLEAIDLAAVGDIGLGHPQPGAFAVFVLLEEFDKDKAGPG